VQPVDQADHAKPPFLPELEQVGRNVAVEEEVLVLLTAVLVHAPARMAVALILQVQLVMFVIELQSAPNCC
jgi:DNA phosphorothioation-dependent restriction protein DptG